MALRGDDLFLSYGVMGGFMQVRTRTPPMSADIVINEHRTASRSRSGPA
jgi:hypothetical protein